MAIVVAFGISVTAKLLRGTVDSRESWVFVDRFCFANYGQGLIAGTVHTGEEGHQLLLYNDAQEANWPAVGAMSASCERRVSASSNLQQLHKPNSSRGTDFQWRVQAGAQTAPHEWFVAVANCGGHVHVSRYELSLFNDGPWWRRQFSCELAFVIPMYSSYALALTMMLLLLLAVSRESRRPATRSGGGGAPPPVSTVTLGMAAAACGAGGALFTAAHFAVYARRGYGVEPLRVVGGAGEVCAVG